MAGPLADGYRILDLSERSPAAAVAGMVLADLGAEVIRVEPQGGDPVRVLAGSRVWLRGQKSVTIGPAEVESGQWRALRDSADAILTTAQPWTTKPAGLLDGYPNNDRQVLAVLTAYPRAVADVKYPHRGIDAPVCGEIVEAEYGCMDAQEGWREGPIFLGWPHAAFGAAWLLQLGIVGALLERERTGKGQVLTTSLFDGIAILRNASLVAGDRIGTMRPPPKGTHSTFRLIVSLFECSDERWIQIHTGGRGQFNRLMKAMGRNDLAIEFPNAGMFGGDPMTQEQADELWEYLERKFKTRPPQHWCDLLAKADVCCMPALLPGEALWLEQMEVNGLVDILPDGERRLGKVAKFARNPMVVGREIPTPGQHDSILLRSAGATTANTANSHDGAAAASATDGRRVGPLHGITVLDFGFYMAGPFANRIFADLGARVIKVEEYHGDPMRSPNLSMLLGTHRGKQSIAVNLKSEQGRAVIYELVRRADVVHHNMRAGAMERLGMGYDALSAINPRLIYCHSSGYGNEGPWALLPTFEPLHSALGGLLTRTGGELNAPRLYLSHMDYGCGLTSATMTIAALAERERSGKGQYLEVPQTGAGLLAISDAHGFEGRLSETFPLDYDQRGHAPTNALYRTSDGWIVIACYSDVEWDGVRRALGIDYSQWPGYEATRQEKLGESKIAQILNDTIVRISTADNERRLRVEGVPCAVPRPLSAQQILTEPSLRSLNVAVAEHHPEGGNVLEVGHTIRFGNANAIHLNPVPLIGQNSIAILRELGKSEAEIASLIEGKIIRDAGQDVPPQIVGATR
ncbi:MAG TPA: CoA transferase [Candidatus Binataceae bacterium]|nr:CoA transferase [Candidatus Binataceae bacterium]